MKKTRQETEKPKTPANEKESIMEDGINNDVEICISTQEMIQDARERRKTKMTVFHCEQCDYTSSSKTLLKRHTDHNHNYTIETPTRNMRKRFNCEKCDFNSTQEYDLTKHKNTTHVHRKNILKEKVNKSGNITKRIHCSYCDKKFNKKETFEKHMNTFHR